ncbi:hypothetical protein BDA99DRAFT_576780 [Phascolomyces articulosus]|uniref:Uncharacterized protein n=1 Tax=Phascolomyces articulosus TaxID=60185 RepID=A0AAD5P7P4_9FUNG|nr:hypothetical protein BDA99DRAFT_576780 [Phascolomyces articulosus]
MSTPLATPEEVIKEYIQNQEHHPLTLAKFIEAKKTYIVSNIVRGHDYKSFWSALFLKMVDSNNMVLEKSKPNWNDIERAITQNTNSAQPPQTSSVSINTESSNNNSSSSNNNNSSNAIKLTEKDLQNFRELFEKLDEESFWVLSTGTVVEIQMKKFALNCTHEHPSHSLILDTTDRSWRSYFTDKELEEIEKENQPTIRPLPPQVVEYLNHYASYKTMDDIWEESTNGEYVSKATTECANADRSISAAQAMSRRKIGTKTDLLFTTQFFEFGTCEASKTTDITSTKTLQEAGIKIPRTLKDMLYVLSNECPTQLKTCGLAISGLNILPIVMDSPKGYVARVNRPQRFFHHPSNESNFYKNMTTILKIILNMKMMMSEVVEVIDNTPDDTSFGSRRVLVLPKSFIPEIKTSKKRKFGTLLKPTALSKVFGDIFVFIYAIAEKDTQCV